MREVLGLSHFRAKLHFFFFLKKLEVRILFKKGHFSAVFSGYGTYLIKFFTKFGLGCARCHLAESGRTLSKNQKRVLVLSKNLDKNQLLKFPSFNFDNILTGSSPHVWICAY